MISDTANKIVIILVILIGSIINAEFNINSYWEKRARLRREEEKSIIGANLSLNCEERLANYIFMAKKNNEINEAFTDPDKFLPSRNFLEARSSIEQSEVFKIIKKMPKGAILHAHDTAIVSDDWIFHNVTYRDNLYVCDENNTLSLKFFDKPTLECNWKLLSELRQNETQAADVNTKIRRQLSMITTDPSKAYPTVNAAWDKFSNIFIFIHPLLTYRPVFRDHFYQGLKEFYEDNILWIELRTTMPLLYELDGTINDPLEVLRVYKEVTDRFQREHKDFVGVKIILAPNKLGSQKAINERINLIPTMMRNYPNFFAGLDLVGQEDPSNPIKDFIPKFLHLIDKVKFYFHAGETNWYGLASDENLLDAILLNTTRIGHGYAVVKHPEVLEIVKQRNIPIEVCPISNQVLGLVKDLRNHPANILFASNFPVVVSNDDPGLWGSKALSYDFYEAFMGMMSREADIRALKQLAINSIDYSSMNDYQKVVAKDIWSQKWNKFVNNLSSQDPHSQMTTNTI
ncbi:adenosine deaminase AGSA-like [Chelonus insularis]|uniref:adenosine deaminase AGSA-like n=1 Tax=Chelonus insularis TaxID=460826 RepID=UPI001589D681|nr:adenosine deaminase AGSA-like [Chelonus insularis]